MVTLRGRKKPVVASDSDEDKSSSPPPPKRAKRGTRLSAEFINSKDRTRRASSEKPGASSKSPGKPKPIYKPITSFFGAAPRSQPLSQPTPSPEKTAASTPIEIDDEILDSSDEDRPLKKPTALPVRKRRSAAALTDNEAPLKGSQKFIRTLGTVRQTPVQPVTIHDSTDRRPWNEKYGPTSLDELAVHKRKVDDVRKWLTGVLDGMERKRLLILKGPAGSGKTTTVTLLSKELDIHVHEWKNPTSSISLSEGFLSATAQFEDFVGRTGAFGSLAFEEQSQVPVPPPPPTTETGRQRQLILVEEFPNTFTRTSSVVQSFRSSVLNYLAAATPSATAFFSGNAGAQPVTPVVMIISETLLSTNTASADSFTAHRLLGPEILTHPGVTMIEFNPIAPTFMTKALDVIVLKEARKSGRKKTVGPQVIRHLTELGDIRSAVATLEFLCLRGDNDDWSAKVNFSKKKGPKDTVTPMTKMEKESLELVTQRESTLGIFHAVGRVVYNKRIPEDPEHPVPQPDTCFPERRRPKAPEANVDALIDEIGTDTGTFIAALHENYVLSTDAGDSEETLDCITGCIDALSDADLLSPDRFGKSGRKFQVTAAGTGTDNLRQDEMSFQTSVRGLLYNLPSPVKRIVPPPGVMGTKSNGVAGTKQGSAHAMYYPASLRLWKQQEEIGSLLEMWISRAQRGELLNSLPGAGTVKHVPAVTGGVDTWRKAPTFAAQNSNPPTSSSIYSKNTTAPEEPLPPILLGSGGSARYEMLHERLPYLPAIIRKKTSFRPLFNENTTSTIREIEKITRFKGTLSHSASADDDDDDALDTIAEGESGEREQWSTDKPGYDSPRKQKRVRIVGKEANAETKSAVPGIGLDAEGGNGVLSDDDIED